jgi:hypothetical protein
MLAADAGARGLMAIDPFGGQPPRFIRVDLYRYRFAPRGARAWWERTRLGPWLPPLAVDTDGLRAFIERQGWPSGP